MEYCDGGDLMKRIKQQRGVLFEEDEVGLHFEKLFFHFVTERKKNSFHFTIDQISLCMNIYFDLGNTTAKIKFWEGQHLPRVAFEVILLF